jgi:uncharacterized protein
MKTKILFLLIIYLFILHFTFIDNGKCQDVLFPDYIGYVNDYVNILSEDTKYRLTALLEEVEAKTTSQVAIVTIDTTIPLDIESYAVKLFKKWGIGRKGKDNGILLLIAIKDRSIRIEVGYGLEGIIPDAVAKLIIEESITPSFKDGDFNTGILKGTIEISNLIAKGYNIQLSTLDKLSVNIPVKGTSLKWGFIFILLIFLLFWSLPFGWWLFFPSRNRRSGRNWYGGGSIGYPGGFGGGFGGFGGGSSGGGGASGKW